MKSIVVGVDGSPASQAALRWALDLAPRLSTTVRAVMVVNPISWPLAAETGAWMAVDAAQLEADARLVLDRTISAVARPDERGRVERRVVSGVPARRLVVESIDASMIVIGGKRRRALARLVEGSIETALLRNTACPMVVVPEHHEIVAEVHERFERDLALVG